MANLKASLLEAAIPDEIEAVKIGDMCGWGDYGSERIPGYKNQKKNEVLSWAEAAPMIDYEFDDGFGSPGCNDVVAWTKSKVIYIHEYDGSTEVRWLPRNPA